MNKMVAILCVPFLMLVASPAFAQNRCNTVVVGNPVYSTPHVVTKQVAVAHEVITPVAIPVALPVVVPAYTYQYVPPVTVAAAAPVYPGGAAPAYGTNPYGQPGTAMPQYGMPQQQTQYNGPYQQQPTQPNPVLPNVGGQNNDKLRELAKLLLEEMRRQDAADQNGDQGPPMAVYPGGNVGTPPAQPPFGGPPAQPQPGLGGRPNPQSQLAQPAINALARTCMSCHTGPGSKGGAVIFSQQNVLNPDAPFRTMLGEIQSGRMPPRSSNYALTADEYQAVTAWLEGR